MVSRMALLCSPGILGGGIYSAQAASSERDTVTVEMCQLVYIFKYYLKGLQAALKLTYAYGPWSIRPFS